MDRVHFSDNGWFVRLNQRFIREMAGVGDHRIHWNVQTFLSLEQHNRNATKKKSVRVPFAFIRTRVKGQSLQQTR